MIKGSARFKVKKLPHESENWSAVAALVGTSSVNTDEKEQAEIEVQTPSDNKGDEITVEIEMYDMDNIKTDVNSSFKDNSILWWQPPELLIMRRNSSVLKTPERQDFLHA